MAAIKGGSSLYGVSVAIYQKVSVAFQDIGEVFDGFLPEEKEANDVMGIIKKYNLCEIKDE